MKVKAILIDDERKALITLKKKIECYHSDVEIIKTTQEPIEAIQLLNAYKPDIVFLDIAMPQLSGFDVVTRVKNLDFELIFTTAYDKYAIEAINLCAIGYLLKPIDNVSLKNAIDRAKRHIRTKNAQAKNKLLIENLLMLNPLSKKMMVPVQEGFELINIKDIIRCEGVNGYTNIHIQGRSTILSSNSIGYFEKNLTRNSNMCMVHKSHLVNIDFIEKYLKEGSLILINKDKVPVSKNRKSLLLETLKR